jgi:hypothetical protein
MDETHPSCVMNLMEAMKFDFINGIGGVIEHGQQMKMQHLVDNMKDSNEMDEIDNTIDTNDMEEI